MPLSDLLRACPRPEIARHLHDLDYSLAQLALVPYSELMEDFADEPPLCKNAAQRFVMASLCLQPQRRWQRRLDLHRLVCHRRRLRRQCQTHSRHFVCRWR